MRNEQFWHYYNLLRADIDDALRDRAHKLLESGAINLESWGVDFQLAKIVMTDALRNEADQYRPHTPEGKKLLKNLEHF